MSEKSYYAIIPACVRYSKLLVPNAKLMYGEVTALSNENGFCYASNKYFSKLYGVSNETVTRWIKSLEKENFIRIEYSYRGAEITKRKIFINTDTTDKKVNRRRKSQSSTDKKVNRTTDEIVKENNTSYNSIEVIKQIGKSQFDVLEKVINDFSLHENKTKIVIEWLDYRKQIKKPYKSTKGMQAFLRKIHDCKIRELQVAISKAIENEWQSFHIGETKEKLSKNSPSNFDEIYNEN